MITTFIALGSNLGDRVNYCVKAVLHLTDYGIVEQIAPLYETGAYGMENQPSFLNSAVRFKTKLTPEALLMRLKEIEQELGRKNRIRWGPREIDLDIIFYGERIIQRPELTVPHPDFHNRRFVLQPLADLAPNFQPPGFDLTVEQLLNALKDSLPIRLIAKEWYPHGINV